MRTSFSSPLQVPRKEAGGKKSNSVVGILIALFFFVFPMVQTFLEAGPGAERLIGVLIPVALSAAVAALVFYAAAKRRKQRTLSDSAAAAGHLCESHNGVPTARVRRRAGAAAQERTHAPAGSLRRKTEEINDLYAAGIIDGAERAERLAALR